MVKANQKYRILEYMRQHNGITPMEAFGELSITKLATRIGELIEDGHKIRKVWVDDVNRYGEHIRYMRYFLVEIR